MKTAKLPALKIILLIFAAEFFIMFVLDHIDLPHFWKTLLDSAAIAAAALFLMRYYHNAISSIQSKFSDLAAQIPDSVIITSPAGEITYVNPAFEKTTGYTLHEAVGKNPNILKSGKHGPSFYRNIWQTLTGGQLWRGQIINKKKDGVLYTEDVVIFPVIDKKGKPVEFIGIWKDITDKLLAEEKSREAAEQLVQAQKMDTVGKLAGGIAHDFNNILGAILGYTDFLIKDLKNMPQQVADALEVKKAAERAATLTKQLLTFSRKKAAVQRIVNLNDAIKGLLPMLGKITGENIKLEFSPKEDITLIKIDPTHLEQVIMNLVINARDAMPRGGTITVKTKETLFAAGTAPAGLTAGRYMVFSVADTGTGMSEEIKKKIFEPFFTTKPEGKGTGLGLSIVYGVIKQNNAQITVDSGLNEGTTFTVYIPAADAAETAAAPESQRQGTSLKGTETILIAEDDEAFRAVLLRVLKEQGYNALAAANAGEALSLAKEHAGEIQLLLTDMRMPGKTGPELAEELLKSRPAIGLLYMTGYSDTDILEQHHINEAVQLHKPIEFPQLLAKIRETLDKKH